ncbi:MAG: YCF48-related protein [Fuerstiella sp.]|nr:YCF48-related protein [Fuerstiella sp.]
MTVQAVFFQTFIAWTLLSLTSAAAEYGLIPHDPNPQAFSSGRVHRSAAVVDDASLYDVATVGLRCWAVGERGVILRSDDAGKTWKSGVLPFDCSLNSVCFLTNRIGFVAGTRLDLHSKSDRGVLLTTRDGGQTWKNVSPDVRLRGLRSIRFFGLEKGVAITTPNQNQGGTLLITTDAGQTWKEMESHKGRADWVSAAFMRPNEGILVGRGQAYGLVNNNKLTILGYPRNTLQTVNAASLSDDGRAWIVGDGGYIRRSTNRGVSWKIPARFPDEIRDVYCFRSVVHDGERVCVAGTPASSALVSVDSGTTWTRVPCARGGSINRLIRTGSDSLLAVGSWGMILQSDNFGQSWKNVRNGNRRSALMYIVTNPQDAAPLMLAEVAGEQGYRVSVLQPSERLSHQTMPERWRSEMSGLGVNTLTADWRFARTKHQQAMSQPSLLNSWDESSDGRLRKLLPLRLAAGIRTWRPNVICIESSGDNDGVAAIWRSVIASASEIAAGSDPRAISLLNAGLLPWSAERIINRTHENSTVLEFQADTLLPTLRTTAGLIAQNWCFGESAGSRLRGHDVAYAMHSTSPVATPNTMFQDIPVIPGGDGRRKLTQLDQENDDLEVIVQKHHTQKLAVTGQIDRRPMGGDLIAHMQTIGTNVPEALASAQLQHTLELFCQRENLEGRIAVQKEFTRRFPASPQAAHAAEDLHLLYSSAEILILRKNGRPRQDEVRRHAGSHIPTDLRPLPSQEQRTQLLSVKPWVLPAAGTSLDRFHRSNGSEDNALNEHWHQQAGVSQGILNQLAPDAASSAQQQLIVAARYRRMQQPGKERTALAAASRAPDRHRLLAINEMQAGFSAVEPLIEAFNLPETDHRPRLDGVLSDQCWQEAPEIRLTGDGPAAETMNTLVMLSWDSEFLYFGGHVPTVAGIEPAAEKFDRTHDEADMKGDHIELKLDIDRDYSTAWHFVIDSAGRTSDRCWQFDRWDPQWFVATDRDQTGWRFEVAIPTQELQLNPLEAGARWAMSVRRVVPGYTDQRVEVREDVKQLKTRYSLIRFIRNRRPKS